MNPYKSRKIARIIAIIIVVVMVVTSITALGVIGFGSYNTYGADGAYSTDRAYGANNASARDVYLNAESEVLKEYVKYIQDMYKDEIDYKLLMKGAFAGVADILEDPYSEYYIDTNAGRQFIDSATGTFEGVGLSLEAHNGYARVISAIPGTPAGKAGIKSGDLIVKVNGVAVDGDGVSKVVELLRGESGSKVDILISRDGVETAYTLTREVIHATSVEGRIIEDGVGYIRIFSFDNDSDIEFRDMRAALTADGAKSFIIDLRNNPGGVVETVRKIASQLMPAGPVTHFMRQGKIIETRSADGAGYMKTPLVLLINKGSASGSEILAAALQDTKTAALVGVTTYGKGVGQEVIEFVDGGMMKFSTFYFLSPNKNQINKVGVKPDYVVAAPEAADNEALIARFLSFAPMSEEVKPSLGTVGLNVYGAQQRLELLGYDVDVTGNFDANTAREVSRFQTSAGMYAYGVLDYTTMNKLTEACFKLLQDTGSADDNQLAKALEIIKTRD
ncbi:MAG: S41 family peptidase [Clostridiales Family XIII bacterium]|jgi:carboxyl-terminal processing protease|nr:S41 family peptidase [Clostridiales Family XIII bacterium]